MVYLRNLAVGLKLRCYALFKSFLLGYRTGPEYSKLPCSRYAWTRRKCKYTKF